VGRSLGPGRITPEGDQHVWRLKEGLDVTVVEQEDHPLARQVERERISVLQEERVVMPPAPGHHLASPD
jgi:hypothetical protein